MLRDFTWTEKYEEAMNTLLILNQIQRRIQFNLCFQFVCINNISSITKFMVTYWLVRRKQKIGKQISY